MPWQIWWKHSCSPKIVHSFRNSFKKIPDFKSWVNGYLSNGLNVFVGHTEMHLFQFFIDEVRWLVMQYKVSFNDALWNPKDGMAIWLWKEDGNGWPKLLVGVSNPIPFRPIWGNDELKVGEKERLLVARFQSTLSSGS
jgi:hypothetical protein